VLFRSNITGGSDLAIMEVDQATNIIFEEAGQGANIIFGAVIDPSLNDEIMVTVIATGFNHKVASDEISNTAIESHLETKQQYKSVTEQENVPLHEQDHEYDTQPEQLPIENTEPKKLFDDLNHLSSTNDLEVPAFLRRQQD
jgi:cell division protein FtsZ